MSDVDSDDFFDNASNPFRDDDALATSQQHHSHTTSGAASFNPHNHNQTTNNVDNNNNAKASVRVSTAEPTNNNMVDDSSDVFGESSNPFGNDDNAPTTGNDDVFGESRNDDDDDGTIGSIMKQQQDSSTASRQPLSLSGESSARGGAGGSMMHNSKSSHPLAFDHKNIRDHNNNNNNAETGSAVTSAAQTAVSQGMMNMDFAAGLFTPDRVVMDDENNDESEESKIPNLPLDQLPVGTTVWVCNKREVKLLAQNLWTNEMAEYCGSGMEGTILRYSTSACAFAVVSFVHRGKKGTVKTSYTGETEEEKAEREKDIIDDDEKDNNNENDESNHQNVIVSLTFPRAALSRTPPPKPHPSGHGSSNKDGGMRFGLDPKGAPNAAKRLKNEYVVLAPTKKLIRDPMAPRPKNKPKKTLEDVKREEAADRERENKMFFSDFDRATFLKLFAAELVRMENEEKKRKAAESAGGPLVSSSSNESTSATDADIYIDEIEEYKKEDMKETIVSFLEFVKDADSSNSNELSVGSKEQQHVLRNAKRLIAEITLDLFFPSSVASPAATKKNEDKKIQQEQEAPQSLIIKNTEEDNKLALEEEFSSSSSRRNINNNKNISSSSSSVKKNDKDAVDIYDEFLSKIDNMISLLKLSRKNSNGLLDTIAPEDQTFESPKEDHSNNNNNENRSAYDNRRPSTETNASSSAYSSWSAGEELKTSLVLYLNLLSWKIHLIRGDIDSATDRDLVVSIVHGLSSIPFYKSSLMSGAGTPAFGSQGIPTTLSPLIPPTYHSSITGDNNAAAAAGRTMSPLLLTKKRGSAASNNSNTNLPRMLSRRRPSSLPPSFALSSTASLALFNFFSSLNNGLPAIQDAINISAETSNTGAFNLKVVFDKSSYARTSLLCDRYVVQGDELARHSGAPFCIPIELADQPHCANCGSISTPHIFFSSSCGGGGRTYYSYNNNNNQHQQQQQQHHVDPSNEGNILQSALFTSATPRRTRKEFQKQLLMNSTTPNSGMWVTCPKGTDLLFCSGRCADNAWNSFLKVERAGKDYGRVFRSLYYFLQNQAMQFSEEVRAAFCIVLRCLSMTLSELRYPPVPPASSDDEQTAADSSSFTSKLWQKHFCTSDYFIHNNNNNNRNNRSRTSTLSSTNEGGGGVASSTSSGFGSMLMMNIANHQSSDSSSSSVKDPHYIVRSNPNERTFLYSNVHENSNNSNIISALAYDNDNEVGEGSVTNLPSKSITTNPPEQEEFIHDQQLQQERDDDDGGKEENNNNTNVEDNFLPSPKTTWSQLDMLSCFSKLGVYPPPQNAQIEGDMVKFIKNTFYPALCEIFYEGEMTKISSSAHQQQQNDPHSFSASAASSSNTKGTTTSTSVASKQVDGTNHKHINNEEHLKFTEEIAIDLFLGCFEYMRVVDVCEEATNLLGVDSESTTPNSSVGSVVDAMKNEEREQQEQEEEQVEEDEKQKKSKKRKFAVLSPLSTFNLLESDRHDVTKLFHKINVRPDDPEEDLEKISFHQPTNCRFKLLPNGDVSLVVDGKQSRSDNNNSNNTIKNTNNNNNENNISGKKKKTTSSSHHHHQFAVPQLTPLSVAM